MLVPGLRIKIVYLYWKMLDNSKAESNAISLDLVNFIWDQMFLLRKVLICIMRVKYKKLCIQEWCA